MKKRVLSLVLALALCAGFAAPALADEEFDLNGQYTSGAYSYSLNEDGTATIVAFNKNWDIVEIDTLSIPAELDGHKVTKLGLSSFAYSFPYNVQTVIIPEGVEEIGEAAFSNSNRTTTKLVLPSTLKTIGRSAFDGWEKLDTLVIPENVTSIGRYAFNVYNEDGTKGLKTVICYSKDVEFNTVATPFDGCKNCTFYGYPGSTLENLVNTALTTRTESTQNADGSWSEQKVPTGNTFADIANAPDLDLTAEPKATASFTDVAADAYYAEPVAWAVAEGITNGTSETTFSPNDLCSRAQIITLLYRAAGSPEPAGETPFEDVPADIYYAKATAWAAEHNMASGAAFDPNAPCTREMAVEFMWGYAGSPTAAHAEFSDVSSPAVDWAVSVGVTNGTSATTFSPSDTCTRGQIVTFLYRGFAD